MVSKSFPGLFDLQLTLKPEADAENVPPEWERLAKAALPANPQSVQFRSFSTGVHKVDSGVSYKLAQHNQSVAME